jgi:hypothetical protein
MIKEVRAHPAYDHTVEPISLQDANRVLLESDNCRDYVVARRWPNGVECPTCGCKT